MLIDITLKPAHPLVNSMCREFLSFQMFKVVWVLSNFRQLFMFRSSRCAGIRCITDKPKYNMCKYNYNGIQASIWCSIHHTTKPIQNMHAF